VIDLKPACVGMIALIGGVADGQLTDPTPCADYTVGDLIDHVDVVSRGATALARQDADELDRTGGAGAPTATHLGPDWRDDVAAHLRALGDAWHDPAVWTRPGGVPGSDLSNETWGKIALTEVVVHGWDLARATGQPFELPEVTLLACYDHVAAFVPNAPVPALWGPAVTVAPGASLLDQIVAITGRTP
jgi:uncharacterized protein (TIGR03086 family)